jgi:hypothetical protein
MILGLPIDSTRFVGRYKNRKEETHMRAHSRHLSKQGGVG